MHITYIQGGGKITQNKPFLVYQMSLFIQKRKGNLSLPGLIPWEDPVPKYRPKIEPNPFFWTRLELTGPWRAIQLSIMVHALNINVATISTLAEY